MPSAGLKPAIPEIKLPQTYTKYRMSTGIGVPCLVLKRNNFWRLKETKENG
jgi:hypothetical protein